MLLLTLLARRYTLALTVLSDTYTLRQHTVRTEYAQ
jgi:hypothetical protein